MTEPIDRTQQQPKADFLRHGRKNVGIETRLRPASSRPQRKIALGAIDQHFHRGIGPGKPRGQPRQISDIAALGGESRHHRADPGPGEIQVPVGRIVSEADLCFFERRDQLRF